MFGITVCAALARFVCAKFAFAKCLECLLSLTGQLVFWQSWSGISKAVAELHLGEDAMTASLGKRRAGLVMDTLSPCCQAFTNQK